MGIWDNQSFKRRSAGNPANLSVAAAYPRPLRTVYMSPAAAEDIRNWIPDTQEQVDEVYKRERTNMTSTRELAENIIKHVRSTSVEDAPKEELVALVNEILTLDKGRTVIREIVYDAIDTERKYQDLKWGSTLSGNRPATADQPAGSRTVDEFSCYIIGYADDLLKSASHFADTNAKLDIIRKIAGLCVSAMEQHGAPKREIPL